MKPPTFAPVHAYLYPMLAELARERGYALALHGTMAGDLDLLAAPWVEDASCASVLARDIFDRMKLCGLTFEGEPNPLPEPEPKPHGRLAWNLPLRNGAYVDLSVMPRLAR